MNAYHVIIMTINSYMNSCDNIMIHKVPVPSVTGSHVAAAAAAATVTGTGLEQAGPEAQCNGNH